MHRKHVLFKSLFASLVAGLLLPMMICIVMALAVLLDAVKDTTGGSVLRYVALAGGVAWAVNLVAIVLLLAISTLNQMTRNQPHIGPVDIDDADYGNRAIEQDLECFDLEDDEDRH